MILAGRTLTLTIVITSPDVLKLEPEFLRFFMWFDAYQFSVAHHHLARYTAQYTSLSHGNSEPRDSLPIPHQIWTQSRGSPDSKL